MNILVTGGAGFIGSYTIQASHASLANLYTNRVIWPTNTFIDLILILEWKSTENPRTSSVATR